MSGGEPAQVRGRARKGYFDRFAQRCGEFVSKELLFTFCVALVVVWAPTFFFMDFDTWQLLINSSTTIITFLLVALLHNTQRRGEQAINKKLDAIADGMATRYGVEDNNELRSEIEDSRQRLASKRRCERPEPREGPWPDRCTDHRHETARAQRLAYRPIRTYSVLLRAARLGARGSVRPRIFEGCGVMLRKIVNHEGWSCELWGALH